MPHPVDHRRPAHPVFRHRSPWAPPAIMLSLALLSGCAAPSPAVDTAPAEPDIAAQANIGLLKQEARRYHDDGRYERDLARVDALAGDWLAARAAAVSKPALVLDIDETSLSNWDSMVADDFGFIFGGRCDHLPAGPCGFGSWVDRAAAPAIAPTLALARRARSLGVAVFFITGRKADETDATARNLRQAGYADWSGLVLEPVGSHFAKAEDFKAPARAEIERQGYTILATVGDQWSDLLGGHAERGFKLPNPWYYLP
ncbi:HAD family acid phosphatase [Rhizosaccharibacter radicis]|uniref:Acid phosphatase n=1 Tax=Rhizosaccharibacter radicis TaxID=2782605 RepID=A0ABT1VWH9_9PROT|nr:acid phosphatase [Acetobacteraceae bacterium KSS12]